MSKLFQYPVNRAILVILSACLFCKTAFGQYYYKDLVSTNQINESFKRYKANKVGRVTLISFQGNTPVTEGFECEQRVSLARNQVTTYTKTADAGESYFTAYYNPQGMLARSVDSSSDLVSSTLYTYDANNRLQVLTHESHAADNSSNTSEKHIWQYAPDGKPAQMLRIRNGADTTIVRCTVDEKGNVTGEEGTHKGVSTVTIYYYYDEHNRMTDVVRYNAKARRLLPDYIFEYEDDGELSSMTIVPEGSNDYQKWYYTYNDAGLKAVEFCYDKKSVLLGKVEYNYTFGR